MEQATDENSTPETSYKDQSNEEDADSWVDIDSQASADSVDVALYDDGAMSIASGTESPDAADLFFARNRNPQTPTQSNVSAFASDNATQHSSSVFSGPTWWRSIKGLYTFLASTTNRLFDFMKPYFGKLKETDVTSEEQSKKQTHWFISSDVWKWIKHGTIAVTAIACIGIFVRNRSSLKALFKKNQVVPSIVDSTAIETSYI